MAFKYSHQIKEAVRSFWLTKEQQGSVLPGKQLDAFLLLLSNVAIIISPKGNLLVAIELKSQVGSYGNNLNNRIEESLGSAEDFWTAFREKSFPCNQSPWLGYLMVVGEDDDSTHVVNVSEPHFKVRKEFRNTSYLERYKILCERLLLEHKYNAVGLIATKDENHYHDLSSYISISSFIDSLRGFLIGHSDEFKQ